MNYEEHFTQSAQIREKNWKSIGNLHTDVITHLINPAFMGGPEWPSTRQAFVVIDTPSGTILSSDGLSDPYNDFDENPDNQAYNGIGCEFYIECSENLGSFDDIKSSWQFTVVYQAAQLAAGNPNIASIIQEHKYVSTELYHCTVPESFQNEHERVGVLLGLSSKQVPAELELSLEKICLVNVMLLTKEELAYITENGSEARLEVAKKLEELPASGKSFLERKSVV
ncbi:suppressor of fused domain protein [Fluviicola taffensis]|uniref:Uncharacterized protein n=1 Tax=Fluviicola taffensis (strain DSM 16823 / NCIMB 13979 / RW262) TaxID=755732 RepID=F2II89_FLUTR|nr:suppressor of fused domain protein [Fluviicola taffensis]AEA43798.1 hypothetical protein Fluta_1809 [Fluviicola taffensis DSM 16823]